MTKQGYCCIIVLISLNIRGINYIVFNIKSINRALFLLGERLEIESSEPLNIIVCGGSALIITGLIKKRIFTKDIDIVGIGYKTPDRKFLVKECKNLPEPLGKVVKQVAGDLGLEEKWINTGPTELVKFGLPEGFTDRFHSRKYSNVLTVHFIGRVDQIYFKLYAAVDQGAGKHVDDLIEMNPTEIEIEGAAKWAMTHDTSEGFRQVLIDMLRKVGYGKIAERI